MHARENKRQEGKLIKEVKVTIQKPKTMHNTNGLSSS